MKICVYPGSFDPVTNGHMDIIQRAAKICDKLVVAIGNNQSKKAAFSLDERIELLKCCLKDYPEVEVNSFTGLLIDFVNKMNANTIIKGLRAVSDFEYELQMALLNKHLDSNVETLFMMTNIKYSYLSSSAVRELARIGGDISGLVPECIKDRVVEKLRK
ncbi:MAG: pantetheine-phosphate adenylyltransferase [Acetivibrionales bacterium]